MSSLKPVMCFIASGFQAYAAKVPFEMQQNPGGEQKSWTLIGPIIYEQSKKKGDLMWRASRNTVQWY